MALMLAGCGPEPVGTVHRKYFTTGPHVMYLVIKKADGSKDRVVVGWYAWRHCHKRDPYPACAQTSGR